MRITTAQRNALYAVGAGRAYRIYRGNGNTMHCKGIASSVLWSLNRLNLIRDGRADNPAALQIRCQLELSDAGRKALWHEDR